MNFLDQHVKLASVLASLYKQIEKYTLAAYYTAHAIQLSIRAGLLYDTLAESLLTILRDFELS